MSADFRKCIDISASFVSEILQLKEYVRNMQNNSNVIFIEQFLEAIFEISVFENSNKV